VSGTKPVCENCGARAIVHVRYDPGDETSVRHLCLTCADAEAASPAQTARNRPLDRAAILVVVGLLILVISVGADFLAFGSAEEFGWKQMAGVALGVFLLVIGAVIRVLTLMVIGFITGTITLLADWLGFGSAEGFGGQQITGVLLGIAMLVAGFIASFKKA